MIDVNSWTALLLEKLQAHFGKRLLFLGLQGSYQRGEAHEGSDIDIVTVLDRLDIGDLSAYKKAIRTMPEAELACGFICGLPELKNWPRYDLFQLKMDTRTLYGDKAILPEVTKTDIADSICISAAAMLHEVCHRYLYSKSGAEGLAGCYKSAFFLLQAKHYLQSGAYISSRRGLAEALASPEREIMERAAGWEAEKAERDAAPEKWFALLYEFLQQALKEYSRF